MSINFLTSRARNAARTASALLRRRVALATLAVLGALAVPTVALSSVVPQWFQLWTGGAPMMMSGEGIGSLPSYLTPDTVAPVPGATPEQNALQGLPSLEVNVPYTAIFDAVPSADGDGYVFIGPGATPNDALVRLFGDLLVTVDPTHLEGRHKTLSWNVGPSFAGANLYYVIGDASSMGTVSNVSGPILLPVQSPAWQAAFDSGSVILALVRADGAVATLHLDASGDQVVAVQHLP